MSSRRLQDLEAAWVVDGAAEERGHMEIAGKVVDAEAKAPVARTGTGRMADSEAAWGTRQESRGSASSLVVGKPTERGWRVWGVGVQHRCR